MIPAGLGFKIWEFVTRINFGYFRTGSGRVLPDTKPTSGSRENFNVGFRNSRGGGLSRERGNCSGLGSGSRRGGRGGCGGGSERNFDRLTGKLDVDVKFMTSFDISGDNFFLVARSGEGDCVTTRSDGVVKSRSETKGLTIDKNRDAIRNTGNTNF